MGKGRYFGKLAVLVAVSALVAVGSGGSGCGTSNDQGISFRATGWTEDAAGANPVTGVSAPLACTNEIRAAISLENNMLQGIQVERGNFSYRVSGSSLAIPNSQQAISARLGPATGQENSPPRSNFEVSVVPANIVEFLNNNRNQLPPLPFGMTVTATATGITDAGDQLTTNRIGFHVEWLEDDACETGEGGFEE